MSLENPLKHDASLGCVYESEDVQRTITVAYSYEVLVWSIPTGELVKLALNGQEGACLL